jgi:hypothetical protein
VKGILPLDFSDPWVKGTENPKIPGTLSIKHAMVFLRMPSTMQLLKMQNKQLINPLAAE